MTSYRCGEPVTLRRCRRTGKACPSVCWKRRRAADRSSQPMRLVAVKSSSGPDRPPGADRKSGRAGAGDHATGRIAAIARADTAPPRDNWSSTNSRRRSSETPSSSFTIGSRSSPKKGFPGSRTLVANRESRAGKPTLRAVPQHDIRLYDGNRGRTCATQQGAGDHQRSRFGFQPATGSRQAGSHRDQKLVARKIRACLALLRCRAVLDTGILHRAEACAQRRCAAERNHAVHAALYGYACCASAQSRFGLDRL